MKDAALIKTGTLSFSVESRLLRELGERLVKQPEVAIVELIKNSYDADAENCTISQSGMRSITVTDDGVGMTLEDFTNGWMRIGTSAKKDTPQSKLFHRPITGEKGIGRFAVRFLGRRLSISSVALDKRTEKKTLLTAEFDWPKFDKYSDLGKVKVPYRLVEAEQDAPTGTILEITRLRKSVNSLDLKKIRTGTIGVLSPLKSLFRDLTSEDIEGSKSSEAFDPGFSLNLESDGTETDVASEILDNFTLRSRVRLIGNKLRITVFKPGRKKPYYQITDKYDNEIGELYADIRFFPRRAGAFSNIGVDGRMAYPWIAENSGVAVFDRNFRVPPYGADGDDWLKLQEDSARNRRGPRTSIAEKHFPMSKQEHNDPALNWMLKLPQSLQLIGVVQVEGIRSNELDIDNDEEGLIASADREGFVENDAYLQLQDIIRASTEAIAYCDRKIQLEEQDRDRKNLLKSIKAETNTAIQEVQSNPNIAKPDKSRIITALANTQKMAERQDESFKEKKQQLEVMSLLGVVAGFMTHEFGVAVTELENASSKIKSASTKKSLDLKATAIQIDGHIEQLKEFVKYSSGYIRGAKTVPEKHYAAKPRVKQVKRVFGQYAKERGIAVNIKIDNDLLAPKVPPSLYNGIALNLYTNALKAVTAYKGDKEGVIQFKAWSDSKNHILEVSDNGVGVPDALGDAIFEPLFTTTDSSDDPLGSGMGLGLALVRRAVEAFGGKVKLISAEESFSTTIQVRIPND
jgi:signal transduction histidine kinase